MMDLDEIKLRIQRHVCDGLVTIVGSGVSAGFGLPTMAELAEHLLRRVPEVLCTSPPDWRKVADQLGSGMGLEAALASVTPDEPTQDAIITATAELIADRERTAFEAMLSGVPNSIRDLLVYLLKTSESATVITPNYDRVVEFSAETANLGVDSLFVGQYCGRFDPVLSRDALKKSVSRPSRTGGVKFEYRKHVRVLKPHGSLDWFSLGGRPVRLATATSAPRLMITPGLTKYMRGYDEPFDRHREEANRAIDNAAGFFIIGYGFNDVHLEKHLRAQLARGVPCLLCVRSLTPNAEKVVADHGSVLSLSRPDHVSSGTLVSFGGNSAVIDGINLWDLKILMREVLTT